MMIITVENESRIRFAKWRANKLFGDPDQRQNEMRDEELLRLFNRVWEKTLEGAIGTAAKWDSRVAYTRISDKEKHYFDFDQEHRQFRLKDQSIEFIAQLKPLNVN